MSLIGRILKCGLPLAAAGLMYCAGSNAEDVKNPDILKNEAVVVQKKKKNDLQLMIGISIGGNFDNSLDNPPRTLKQEAAHPYMVFNGERIDTTTTPSIASYSLDSKLKIVDFEFSAFIGIKYKGLFIQPKLLLDDSFSRIDYQKPEPWKSMSYYDIRYGVVSETKVFPFSLGVGYELNIHDFVPSISFDYIRISKYEVYQGIESYSSFEKKRLIDSGKGSMHSFGLGLTYQLDIPKKDGSKIEFLGARLQGEFGLKLKYEFGSIKFDSGDEAKFDGFGLEVVLGFRV